MDNTTRRLMMGAAGAVSPTYIEDVFSTWLYTGNSSTQTITNGIDLSGKGGLVWIKKRTVAADPHCLFDTARGNTKRLSTNTASNETTITDEVTAFNSSGFSLGSGANGYTNSTGDTLASWTFRKQAKFFDVCTWTGDGTDKTINHNLGSAPGVIIAKNTSASGNWWVYHRSLTTPNEAFLSLNSTTAVNQAGQNIWNAGSTSFLASTYLSLSDSGSTYVAYLFAHDAGGFGDSGNDSIIKCGSFTTDGSGNATVNLGWEPQWGLFKNSGGASNWLMFDTMRGAPVDGDGAYLQPNSTGAEFTIGSGVGYMCPTPTGFQVKNLGGVYTIIYIAIRRGPMKTPTDATKVFDVVARTNTGTNPNLFNTALSYVDSAWNKFRISASDSIISSRLTGSGWLRTNQSNAETAATTNNLSYAYNNQINPYFWASGSEVNWLFRRAPGFFDVVAYTGTGSARTVSHNLGVVPELMIVKSRSTAQHWAVYNKSLSSGGSAQRSGLYLSLSNAEFDVATVWWNATAPTSSAFSVGTSNVVNESSATYIAYLFASLTGVSKVGSYTGTGTTQQINCGFTSGSRFVLIKRTDSTGDWYVWDSARGIVSGNDPYLLLNSTAAEVTGTDYVDTFSAGFEISSTAPAAINANGGSYIYLSVA